MAYLPVPTPSNAGSPDGAILFKQGASSYAAPPPPEPSTLLATLREAVADGKHSPDLLYGAIAEAAQSMTEANAAALALASEGIVVCRGRSGEMAPALGARLTVDAGVSGECLRTGKAYRCDDALRDFRVDPAICRQTGLRSIAVVPLRSAAKVSGVLEVFSDRAYAFAAEHVQWLAQLAEIAEAAHDKECVSKAPSSQAITALTPVMAARSPAQFSRVKQRLRAAVLGEKTRRFWAVATGLLVAALMFTGWRMLDAQRAGDSAGRQALRAPLTPVLAATPASALLVWSANPAPRMHPGNIGLRAPSALAIKHDPPGTQEAGAFPPQLAAPNLPDRSAVADAAVAIDEPPPVAPNANSLPLVELASVPANLPTLGAPISEGISPGFLEHKVEPVYPMQARQSRLEGTVVLQAFVTEDGSVRDLKVVSGNPALALAAIAAVKQWRYRPYLLNGKPTRMQTNITVRFTAP